MLQKTLYLLLDTLLFCWKAISPIFFSKCCKFYPTCSEYMVLAIKQKGLFLGLYYGGKRFLKCHPFSKESGADFRIGKDVLDK